MVKLGSSPKADAIIQAAYLAYRSLDHTSSNLPSNPFEAAKVVKKLKETSTHITTNYAPQTSCMQDHPVV